MVLKLRRGAPGKDVGDTRRLSVPACLPGGGEWLEGRALSSLLPLQVRSGYRHIGRHQHGDGPRDLPQVHRTGHAHQVPHQAQHQASLRGRRARGEGAPEDGGAALQGDEQRRRRGRARGRDGPLGRAARHQQQALRRQDHPPAGIGHHADGERPLLHAGARAGAEGAALPRHPPEHGHGHHRAEHQGGGRLRPEQHPVRRGDAPEPRGGREEPRGQDREAQERAGAEREAAREAPGRPPGVHGRVREAAGGAAGDVQRLLGEVPKPQVPGERA
mmetsp:Transcript_20862/g.49766  ORF Transcript_20862/g.49766 Transcript_20862/m.49766 type:complete len:274 (-) Transcript_20862:754-1575(-)